MSDTPTIHWGAEALWEQLVPVLPGLSIEVVPRVGSTNTALLERARAIPDTRSGELDVLVRRSVESGAFGRRAIDLQPCLLVAEHQTAGRGRQGRLWQSATGASLTFSLSLPMAAADWSGLSLAVGVALADALDPAEPGAPGPHIGLKWPNDLWLMDGPVQGAAGGRKLGGILIETVAAGAGQGTSGRLVVVGIGLNVLAFEAEEVRTGFAAMAELDPAATAPTVLARVARPLVEALHRFEQAGFAPFAARFEARDLLRGRTVHTTLPEAPVGVALGVSPEGALWVQTAAGKVAVSSGEVSVRLGAPG
jgi:BirA family transcriptional regulator, biotin operon repressor / biotin---[acetyl-CoA-carboxylase] ligase